MGQSSGKGGQQGQFSYGPSQFDLAQILSALSGNQQAIGNRYTQLGEGNSTMLQQDLAQAGLAAQAAIGQEQTSSATNPATNPALQSPSGVQPSSAINAVSGLGTDVSKIAGLGTNTGGAAAGATSP